MAPSPAWPVDSAEDVFSDWKSVLLESYQLLDFGDGRKLERFGTLCIDRPCPAAIGAIVGPPSRWKAAHWRFSQSSAAAGPNVRGRWRKQAAAENGPGESEWLLDCQTFQLSLKRTPFGHLGVFPEQAGNWLQIRRLIEQRVGQGATPRVLNLFAYTGASTLAAASAGAEVVHVDAARASVQWARKNADTSGLADAPVRWIVEDASRFVVRELKRGNRYDAIILDPPSYGHGPKGEVWKLSNDLMPLLDRCKQLLSAHPIFVLLTCHSPSFGPAEVGACLQQAIFGHCQGRTETFPLNLTTDSGGRLPAGVGSLARFS